MPKLISYLKKNLRRTVLCKIANRICMCNCNSLKDQIKIVLITAVNRDWSRSFPVDLFFNHVGRMNIKPIKNNSPLEFYQKLHKNLSCIAVLKRSTLITTPSRAGNRISGYSIGEPNNEHWNTNLTIYRLKPEKLKLLISPKIAVLLQILRNRKPGISGIKHHQDHLIPSL
jgi:hypothetical protein